MLQDTIVQIIFNHVLALPEETVDDLPQAWKVLLRTRDQAGHVGGIETLDVQVPLQCAEEGVGGSCVVGRCAITLVTSFEVVEQLKCRVVLHGWARRIESDTEIGPGPVGCFGEGLNGVIDGVLFPVR